jgi:hypothetical protein
MDMTMLTFPGGQERIEAQFRRRNMEVRIISMEPKLVSQFLRIPI